MVVVKTTGAGQPLRQQGVVVVHVAEGLRAEAVDASGLLQIDAGELPAALAKGRWTFAYHYAMPDYKLAFDVEKVQPEISVDSLVEAYVTPDQLTLDLTALYTIEKAGVFRLELDVPADYEVRKVVGKKIAKAAPVLVDAYHREGENKTRLVVNLSRKALGRVAMVVELGKGLGQRELRTPGGKAVELAVDVPTAPPEVVQRATGRLVIYAPEGLRVNPGKTSGLRSIPFREAFKGIPSMRQGASPQRRPVLAFAFGQEPVELNLLAERRKPQVTVRQLLVARVEEGVVKYQFTFFYNVLYSGVKSLRIDVPADVAGRLRVVTSGVHEKILDPAPEGLAKGHVAWSLTGESELLGEGKIELQCEKKIEKLGIGKSVELPLPYLKPQGVDRAWGQIVLVKSETIDVHESAAPKSLRPIDPQHDLIAPVDAAARAFEFHDDWTLAITATRYELEEVKRTSIERAVVRMVVTPAETISVQAIYRMRSVQQRLAVVLPEGTAFDTQPLRINGRPATLEKGGQNEYFVPLVAADADKPFVLELRYTLPGDGSRLELPGFPQEPAVVKAYLCAYLPETRALLGVRGPWSEEFLWRPGPSTRWRPLPSVGAERLVQWAKEGVDCPSSPTQDFQTDGLLYVYSTLRPVPGPEGTLAMTAIDRQALNGLVFAVTVLLGLVLLPARLPVRALALGAAVVVLVLAGVFLPTFSLQILNGVFLSAVFIVAVVWSVAWAMRRRGSRTPIAAPTPPDEAAKPQAAEGGPSDA